MKRVETFWQVMVLFLVVTFAVGIYSLLAVGLIRTRQSGQSAAPTPPPQAGELLQVVAPLNGAVVQWSKLITVSALLTEPDVIRAELEVDGRRVAVTANPQPKTSPWMAKLAWEEVSEGAHLLVVQAYGTEGQLATSAPVTVTVVPTGQLVFASNRDGAYAVYMMQTDGHGLARLRAGRQPSWRMDGGLALVTEGEGGQEMIRSLTIAAGETGGVDLVAGGDPDWALGSMRLSYAATVEGVSQVFTATADGRITFQVTSEEAYAGQPAWAPDGMRLAYVAEREGNSDIWVVDFKSGESRRVTDDPAMDWAPAWSPDGNRLAFVSNRGGGHQIYVMRADGADVKSLTSLSQGAESPCWSPDGYWLAFVAYTGNGAGVNARELYLMRADGRDQVRLTHNSSDDTEPDWAWLP